MKNIKVLLSRMLLVLLFCLFSLPCHSASYSITEAEMQEWENELTLQRQLLGKAENSNLQSQAELKKLKEKLTLSQQQSINLTDRLSELKAKSQQQEKQLESAEQALNDANSLLQQYVQEQSRTQNRLRKQRNLAWFLLGGYVIYRLADGI